MKLSQALTAMWFPGMYGHLEMLSSSICIYAQLQEYQEWLTNQWNTMVCEQCEQGKSVVLAQSCSEQSKQYIHRDEKNGSASMYLEIVATWYSLFVTQDAKDLLDLISWAAQLVPEIHSLYHVFLPDCTKWEASSCVFRVQINLFLIPED